MSQLAVIFGISFTVALGGALSPGPLFTYTIMEAGRDRRWGWLVGFKVIAGHAVLEALILIILLAGLQNLLVSETARIVIGLLGTLSLLYFGGCGVIGAVRDFRRDPSVLLVKPDNPAPNSPALNGFFTGRPVAGGLAISMSNPYWWIWWATFGSTMIARWKLSFADPIPVAIFWIGHELGDLAWYLFVAIAASLGLSRLEGKARTVLYGLLSLAISAFGLWIAYDTLVFIKAL